MGALAPGKQRLYPQELALAAEALSPITSALCSSSAQACVGGASCAALCARAHSAPAPRADVTSGGRCGGVGVGVAVL